MKKIILLLIGLAIAFNMNAQAPSCTSLGIGTTKAKVTKVCYDTVVVASSLNTVNADTLTATSIIIGYGKLYHYNSGHTFYTSIVSSPTANRTITYQDGSGTLAFTSDINNLYVPLVGTGSSYPVTGTVRFNNAKGIDSQTITDTLNIGRDSSLVINIGRRTTTSTTAYVLLSSPQVDIGFKSNYKLSFTSNVSTGNVIMKDPFGGTLMTWVTGKVTSNASLDVTSTDYFKVAKGTTGQRITSATGNIRYNTSTAKLESYGSSGWDNLVRESEVATLTNKTLTSPVINVTSDASSDTYYRNSSGLFTRLGIGSNGQVLTVSSGIPSWATPSGGLSTVSNGLTATSGNIKLGGPLINDTYINGAYDFKLGESASLNKFKAIASDSVFIESTDNIDHYGSVLMQGSLVRLRSTDNAFFNSTLEVSNGDIRINTTTGSNNASIRTDLLSTIQTYQYPDTSGVLAVRSDISSIASDSLLNYVKKVTGTVKFDNPSSHGLTVTTDNGGFAKSVLFMDSTTCSIGYDIFGSTGGYINANVDGILIGSQSGGNIAINTGPASSAIIRADNLVGGNKTFQYPNASGTLVISASNGLTSNDGDISLGGDLLNNTFVDGNYSLLFGYNTTLNNLAFKTNNGVSISSNSYYTGLKTTNLTADRDLEFPNNSGTLVLDTATQTLTHKTLTSPIINVGSDATGDTYYRNLGGLFTRLGVGSSGQVLTVSAGIPSWATPTTGTVTSVSGTTNRITSTGGATPVIDISASYVGQASITTVGTLTNLTVTNPITGSTTGNAVAPTISSDATDADYTAVVNSVKYLPGATLTTNRTITIPTGSNGDFLEIYNNETVYSWNITGASVYLSDGTTVITSLYANTNHLIRKVSGKWRILN